MLCLITHLYEWFPIDYSMIPSSQSPKETSTVSPVLLGWISSIFVIMLVIIMASIAVIAKCVMKNRKMIEGKLMMSLCTIIYFAPL